MPITINGSGTVTGISAGGLPDDCITTADIAAGAVTQAKRSEQLTLDTAKASTSGTFIDFTGIPSWVKRVTVMFNGVSTNGTSLVVVQIGATSFATSGYVSGYATAVAGGATLGARSNSFFYTAGNAGVADARYGHLIVTNIASNTWIASGVVGTSAADNVTTSNGGVSLSGTLDRIRVTTVNGTDTFDAGSINILYE